jgi:hypothetical protein
MIEELAFAAAQTAGMCTSPLRSRMPRGLILSRAARRGGADECQPPVGAAMCKDDRPAGAADRGGRREPRRALRRPGAEEAVVRRAHSCRAAGRARTAAPAGAQLAPACRVSLPPSLLAVATAAARSPCVIRASTPSAATRQRSAVATTTRAASSACGSPATEHRSSLHASSVRSAKQRGQPRSAHTAACRI